MYNIRISGIDTPNKQPNISGFSIGAKDARGGRVDYVICDDIITPTDKSFKEREKVFEVYQKLVNLNNGIPNMTVIGQPVHSKDLYAYLRVLESVPKMELPYGTIPELDVKLEILRASGITDESIKNNYLLEIDVNNEKTPFANVQEQEEHNYTECMGFVDPSMKGKDYTAMVIGRLVFNKFITTGFVWKKSWDECMDDIINIRQKYNVSYLFFETNGLGDYPIKILRDKGLNVHGWNTYTKKNGRIINAATHRDNIVLAHSSILIENNTEFIKQIKTFDWTNEYDDAPDCLANLLIALRMINDVIKTDRVKLF
jgi:hypothetical protein